MDDAALERLLFPAPVKIAAEDRNMPFMEYLRKELGNGHARRYDVLANISTWMSILFG
ncbi:MAG: hypothetical protein HY954_05905 [Deltaproteobacteria bacterium]|nr:hypothetical protein [Deltaproteobacteria bacterium]